MSEPNANTSLTTTTGTLPESVNEHEAASLMAGLEDDDQDAGDGDEQQEQRTEAGDVGEAGEEDAGAGETDGGEQEEREQETEAQETQEAAADDAPPQFWDAEDREAYKALPPAAKAVVLKYEQKRVQFEQTKAREAADGIRAADERASKLHEIVEKSAAWWQVKGPEFIKTFVDKWSGVDWNKLASENPAEWARLKQERDRETQLMDEAAKRGKADIDAAQARQASALVEAKRASHAQLAQKLPEFFGPTKYEATYKELGDFLFSAGLPVETINNIYEAPVIELALDAMRFRKARQQASTVTQQRDGTGKFTAKTTPTRVQPGPAARAAGDRNTEQARRVSERFRKSGGADMNDAAALISLNGL